MNLELSRGEKSSGSRKKTTVGSDLEKGMIRGRTVALKPSKLLQNLHDKT